jgi:hypothetical protein
MRESFGAERKLDRIEIPQRCSLALPISQWVPRIPLNHLPMS